MIFKLSCAWPECILLRRNIQFHRSCVWRCCCSSSVNWVGKFRLVTFIENILVEKSLKLTRTDWWTKPRYCLENQVPTSALLLVTLAVNYPENCLQRKCIELIQLRNNLLHFLTYETRRHRFWSCHSERRSEALTTALSSLAVTLINQFVLAHRINTPKASFSGFILRAWYFNKAAI